MNREEKWMQRRVGMITASELSNITSKSGRIIDGNVSYIRSKRFERKHGFALPVSSRAMEIGNETEPMIFEWLKEYGDRRDLVYSKDLEEIPFWVAPDCPLGASPDCFTEDETVVFEFKTLVGNTGIEFFADEFTSYEEKKTVVWSDHGDQILGQFISNPKVKSVVLVKYIPQLDEVLKDIDSPLAMWRGYLFYFFRADYEKSIAAMKDRVRLFNAMIDSDINPSEFKSGNWSVDKEGKLKVDA